MLYSYSEVFLRESETSKSMCLNLPNLGSFKIRFGPICNVVRSPHKAFIPKCGERGDGLGSLKYEFPAVPHIKLGVALSQMDTTYIFTGVKRSRLFVGIN